MIITVASSLCFFFMFLYLMQNPCNMSLGGGLERTPNIDLVDNV